MARAAQLKISPIRSDAERERFIDVADESFASFGGSRDNVARYAQTYAAENIFVGRRAGEVVAALGVIDFEQWFHGRKLRSAGIAAVGVPTVERGSGAATRLMRGSLKLLRERGYVVSTLYPSTYGLYRKAGYEPAGEDIEYQFALRELRRFESHHRVRPGTRADWRAMDAVHQQRFRYGTGGMTRSDWEWHRWLALRQPAPRYYVFEGDKPRDGLAGFIVIVPTLNHPAESHIFVRDWAATTPKAIESVLAFVAGHATIFDLVKVRGAPVDPLLHVVRREHVSVSMRLFWMTRILDLRAALLGRGYSPATSAELHLDVRDDLFDDNAGRWVLNIDGGAPAVRRGGRGRLRLDINAMAALFTGFRTAEELVLTNQAEGSPDMLALATGCFAGPRPWMNEQF